MIKLPAKIELKLTPEGFENIESSSERALYLSALDKPWEGEELERLRSPRDLDAWFTGAAGVGAMVVPPKAANEAWLVGWAAAVAGVPNAAKAFWPDDAGAAWFAGGKALKVFCCDCGGLLGNAEEMEKIL